MAISKSAAIALGWTPVGGQSTFYGLTVGKLAANRTQAPTAIGSNQSANVPITFRRAHYASPFGEVRNIQLVDVHWYFDDTNRRVTLPGSTVTFKRYLEYPAGVYWPVTWGGLSTVTNVDGGQSISDPVTGLVIPAGEQFWERTVITALTGTGVLCLTVLPSSATNLGLTDGNVSGDFGNSSATFNTGTANTVGAAAILGTVAAQNARSVVLVGDSITYGQGDISSTGAKGGSGWSSRMFDARMPWTKIAKPGQSIAQLLSATTRLNTFLAAINYSEALISHGTNDLSDGSSVASIQANFVTLAGLLNKSGAALIHQSTLPPQTTSPDSWATVVNQTILTGGNRAARPDLNDGIRAFPSYLTGQVLDLADANMTARNSGIWATPPAPTADGTHHNSTGAANSAATVLATFV